MEPPPAPVGMTPGRIAAGVLAAGIIVVLAVALAVVVLSDAREPAAQPINGTPTAPATTPATAPEAQTPTQAPTQASTEAPTEAPTEEAFPTGVEPGTTAIFTGFPAIGPWQSIGSVSEIHHRAAGPAARFGYDDLWVPHGLSDDLWDRLVATVSVELVDLGPPLDRPAFDAVDGSEVLNARAGLGWTDEDTDGRGILLSFSGMYQRPSGTAGWTQWSFLIDPDTEQILDAMAPIEITEDDTASLEQATEYLDDTTWDWVMSQPTRDRR